MSAKGENCALSAVLLRYHIFLLYCSIVFNADSTFRVPGRGGAGDGVFLFVALSANHIFFAAVIAVASCRKVAGLHLPLNRLLQSYTPFSNVQRIRMRFPFARTHYLPSLVLIASYYLVMLSLVNVCSDLTCRTWQNVRATYATSPGRDYPFALVCANTIHSAFRRKARIGLR